MALASGARLGPYVVSAKIGEGGMGEVYLAEDTRLKRQVALKTVSAATEFGVEARRRLLREARSAAQLNHPHIAAIYDVLESGDRAYIVMEYVPGETLRTRLEQGPLPLTQVVEIGLQLSEALAAAHRQGIVHRDLKPGNVSLTPDGRIKVLDFGIAKVLLATSPGDADADTHSASVTEPGRFVGTPAYMAPEQLLGQPVGPAADLYAVGVMLFELAAGRHPYRAGTSLAQAFSALSTPLPHLTDVEPSLPSELDALVARAMAKDAKDRHDSAEALASDLKQIRTTASDATPGRPRQPASSKPAGVIGHLLTPRVWLTSAAVLVAALATVTWRAMTPEPVVDGTDPVVVVMPLENVGADPSREFLGVGFADALIANLSTMPGVTVVSRSATAAYRDQAWNARQITRDLGASLVVDGGVQESPDGLSVTVSLTRPDASVAWAETFVGAAADLFDLQRRMAEGVAEGLELTLSSADRQRLARPPTTDLDAYTDYATGRALLDRLDVLGNLEAAIDRFQRAVARDPGFALAHAAMGEAYWSRYSQPERDAAETNPADWVDLATASILEALRLEPDRPQVRIALATIYHGTGRAEAALQELDRALAVQPSSDEAHRLMGRILADQGRLEDALAHYNRAIALRPEYWRSYYDVGNRYFRAGRYTDAVAFHERALQRLPEPNARVLHNIGSAYQQLQNPTRALELYTRAIDVGAGALTYANIGTLHYDEERFEEAAAAYEDAIARGSSTSTTRGNLGLAYEHLGRPDDARRTFEAAVGISEARLEVNPRDAAELARLAVYEAHLGRGADADRHSAEAIALAPRDGEVLFKRAVVLTLASHPTEAVALVARALEHGYPAAEAEQDDDLERLRERADFQALFTVATRPGEGGTR